MLGAETWKDVPGYEGCYQVSNLGNVKNLRRIDSNNRLKRERILKKVPCNGYERVHLSKCGETEWLLVHRLVAAAFVPQKEGCGIVNHIDNNKANNTAVNLEWTTYKGNMQHAAKQGRMRYNPENLQKAQLSREIPVIAIEGEKRVVYKSAAEAGRELGVTPGHIAAACRKEYGYKTVGGYEWEYEDRELQESQRPNRVAKPREQLSAERSERMRGNKIMVGRNLSEQTKSKISVALGRPVIQLSKDGERIQEFNSARLAQVTTGISHIHDCANGSRETAGGFLWIWKEHYNG